MPQMPTLVILPGWGGSRRTWQEFIALASRHFNVLCIDLPCFGAEPCPDEVWGVEEYADFVKSKVQSQKSKVILLGHSFGGQVAVYLASKHPELISHLVLSGAAAVRPNRIIRRKLSQAVAAVGKAILRLPFLARHQDMIKKIFYCLIDSPDYLETSGIKREIYKKIIRQDCATLLPRIKIPTLVVWGARDRMTPLRHGQRVFQLLPNAAWRVFKDMGHAPHREAPEELLTAISTWLYDQSH